ncbi:MAG: CPBP family intramembrane metalloprotease [Bacteroidota bacterium]|nr:CPBP family intramembrane metalloprotease [Bacteroidota bacterium]
MIDKNSKNTGYPAQLAIFLGLVSAGLIIGTMVSAGIWLAMTGRPILALESDMLNPKYYNAVMAMQAISTFFMFFLPVYFFALICYRSPSRFIGFKTPINNKQLLAILAILLLTFPLSGALAELTNNIPLPKNLVTKFKAMETARAAQEAALININSFSKYIVSLIVIGLLPGIFEEVCFRGGLQNILTKWFKAPWVAIILTSILFSAIHASYYGFLVRFALGFILGFVFYYSGSIWLSILIHFLYNGLQVTALYLMPGTEKNPPKDIEQHFPLWAGLVALVLLIYTFKKFKEISFVQQQKFVFEDLDDPNDFHNWIAKESQN